MGIEHNGRSGAEEPGPRGQESGHEPLALSRRTEVPARSAPTPPLRYGTLFGGTLPSRDRILSAASLGALAVGLLLLALTAPWSPLTGEADAQVSGTFDSSAEATTATGDEGGSEGGFAPSVLPEDAPAVEPDSSAPSADSVPAEESSNEPTGQLPEAAPGDSTADERHSEAADTDATGTEADPATSGSASASAPSSAPASAPASASATASAASGCTDYSAQDEAQAALNAGELGLDEDGDGDACEAYFGTGTYDVSPADLETGGMPPAAVLAKVGGLILTAVGLGGLGWMLAGRLLRGWRLS